MPCKRIFPLLLLLIPLAAPISAQTEWKPADGPLMTRWAQRVSPRAVHPEYPRPQMERGDWMNLNSLWQLSLEPPPKGVPGERTFDQTILVPFPIESALSGVMKRSEHAAYRRTFEVPDRWRGQRILLHFGAVDWHTRVLVNGRSVGTHLGGYDPFRFDITDFLTPDGPQTLVVEAYDPSDSGEQPRGKQVKKPGGIYYTPITGIWQTVWLEPVPRTHIHRLDLTPDVDAQRLQMKLEVEGAPYALDFLVTAEVFDGARKVSQTRELLSRGAALPLPVPDPKLWTPERPHLYTLKVTLENPDGTTDTVSSYFGMRKVEVRSDGRVQRLFLNGEPVFHNGLLDQGYWPDGLYTAPTDEALRYDIEVTKRLGYNTIRKHVKVEPARWYYWADRLGVLVWQDMPSGNNRTPESKELFEKELVAMLRFLHNHPSVVMWVVFNEGWGQFDTERLTQMVERFDPSRIVSNASGWTDMEVGDIIDMHNYPGPGSPQPEPNRAAVLGEFGGLGLPIPGHMWSEENWSYQRIRTPEQLTRRYEELMRGVWDLQKNPGLSGSIYTQTTDVETETNGLLTYDRAVIKPDVARVTAVNRGDFSRVPPPPVITPVVPTAEKEPATWRYTFESPRAGWFEPGFDDSRWREGPAGFGTEGTPGSVVRTTWDTSDIWLRRTLTLPPDAAKGDIALRIHHDEDVEVYINGVLAARAEGFTSRYEELPLTPKGRAALKPGENLIAVHVRQTAGGQYFDAGLMRIETK